jgi:transposase
MDGRPYAVDLRERVVPAVETELWRRVAAAKFEVSISCVVKLLQRWHRRGTVQPDRTGGGKRATLAAHAERVLPLLAAEPDLTIVELRSRLAAAGDLHRRRPRAMRGGFPARAAVRGAARGGLRPP